MKAPGKKVSILGLGQSGDESAVFLKGQGFEISPYRLRTDSKTNIITDICEKGKKSFLVFLDYALVFAGFTAGTVSIFDMLSSEMVIEHRGCHRKGMTISSMCKVACIPYASERFFKQWRLGRPLR